MEFKKNIVWKLILGGILGCGISPLIWIIFNVLASEINIAKADFITIMLIVVPIMAFITVFVMSRPSSENKDEKKTK